MKRTPEELKAFYLTQAMMFLTPVSVAPTTETVRSWFVAVWSCGRPEDVSCLDRLIIEMSKDDWQFTGWIDIAAFLEEV